jgi:hypothetical protein
MPNRVVESGSEAGMSLPENAGVPRASALEHNNQTYRYIDNDQPQPYHLLKRLFQFIVMAVLMEPAANLVSTALGLISEDMTRGRDWVIFFLLFLFGCIIAFYSFQSIGIKQAMEMKKLEDEQALGMKKLEDEQTLGMKKLEDEQTLGMKKLEDERKRWEKDHELNVLKVTNA